MFLSTMLRSRTIRWPATVWFAVILVCFTGSGRAHEFWIEPVEYQLAAGSEMQAFLRNGVEFDGGSFPYTKGATNRFDIITADGISPVVARLGDNPALNMKATINGLHVVVHERRVSYVSYKSWEKFQRFVDHKAFGEVLTNHRARNFSETDFKEAYSRYSKSLIVVGEAAGSDRRVGLEIEFVALENPYTDDLQDGLTLAAYYQNQLRTGAQVELFEKDSNGKVKVTMHQTDENGRVNLPVKSGHQYLVDMVVLRSPTGKLAKKKKLAWETVWASLTFAVP